MKVFDDNMECVSVALPIDTTTTGTTGKTNEIQDLLSSHTTPTSADNDNERLTGRTVQIPGCSEILQCLYLCGASGARPDIMEQLNIKFVINATVELPDTPLPDADLLYLKVPVKDNSETDLKPHFDEIADLIEIVRQSDGKTLVHCVAGVSRSASLVLAYLVKHADMSLKDAYHHLKSRRPQIRPNVSFFRQLIDFEIHHRGVASVSMIFCQALGQEIPSVYEPEYRNMELLYSKYRKFFAKQR